MQFRWPTGVSSKIQISFNICKEDLILWSLYFIQLLFGNLKGDNSLISDISDIFHLK